MFRDAYCGQFTEQWLGHEVNACGWVSAKRDMGGVLFLDLYDKTGVLQVVFDLKDVDEESFRCAERLRIQSVISVSGRMVERDESTQNPQIATGSVELRARRISVLSSAKRLPFSLEGAMPREDLRLQYRYLDLRRPEMQKNLRFRHQVQKAAQDYLDGENFMLVETPMLTKSTPEGARDYLVPSRVHPGHFYALPQSPQIFKQLLMVGGVDRYYQVARCFRDEDLRADRQPEFTQVDMEMSFVEQEDILRMLESLFKNVFKKVMGREIQEAFPRMTWMQAMDTYGSDKPDLRFDLPIVDLTQTLSNCGFQVFRRVISGGGVVRALNIKKGSAMTRSEIESLTAKAESYGANGMAWIAVKENGELYSILTKYFDDGDIQSILTATGAQPGDFILFCADELATVRQVLGRLRLDIADLFDLRKPDDFRFAFVTDFPQFEYSAEENRYVASHHPFTMPHIEDVDKLETDPGAVRAQAYDVVLNGVELGSGSIRIHASDVQEKMFRALGFSQQEIEDRFGFFVQAFGYGTPPHGGFAFGLDRLVMLLLGAKSLRDVLAFPKIRDGSCPLTQAPSTISEEQLTVLGISPHGEQAVQTSSATKNDKAIDVEKVAMLARLKLNPSEKSAMERDLQDMVSFAGTLAAIDTGAVAPTAHPQPLRNVFRDDVVVPSQDRAWLLDGAPATTDGFIWVPKVLD